LKKIDLLNNFRRLDKYTRDHIVNFIVKAPNRQPFFHKSINTSGIPQNAVAVSEAIIEVIEEIGPSKFCAVITDNASVMRAAWDLIKTRFPHISVYGCGAHGANLVIKNILSHPEHAKTTDENAKIVQFINNHHIFHAKFEAKRKEAGVKHKLSSPVSTRWFTEYKSAKDLMDAKVLLLKLATEDFDELKEINPKKKSEKALKLMKCSAYWNRLEKLVKAIEYPSNIIGKLETDDAPLYLIYKCFENMYNYFESEQTFFMLVPKYAAGGFYVDEDKVDILKYVNKFVESRYSGLGDKAEEQMVQFASKMSSLEVSRRDQFYK
jgi:hypothetical protein